VRRPLAWLLVALLLLSVVPLPAAAQTTEADVYVAQAILDFDEKKYQDALANLQEALKRESDHVEALYYMGVVHMALRRPDEAVKYLLRAQQKSPQDTSIAFQLGLAYFAQQQYDQAEPLFERVFKADPTIEGLGYYVGFIRYRKKDYRGALEAFRAGRTTDPQLQQLTRFYTGLSLAVLGLPAQASAEVEQALKLAPGSPLTGPAERLRETIKTAAQQGRRLSASVSLGFLYDDNVIVRPGPNGSEPLVPVLRDKKFDSTAENANARFDYTWLRGPLFGWVPREGDSFESSFGYSFFGTYDNDLPSFNVTDHMVNGTFTYKTAVPAPANFFPLANMPAQFGLSYSWDMLYLDETEFLRRNTATLSGVIVEKDPGSADTLLDAIRNMGHLTQAFYRYQNKEFFESNPLPIDDEFRDADNHTWGFLHLLRFAGDKHLVKVGYQFDWEDAQGRNYRYDGHRLLLGVQYTLSLPTGMRKGPFASSDLRLSYDVDVHLRDYYDKNSVLPSQNPGSKWRQDEELNHTVRAEVPFDGPTILGEITRMSLAASYQNTVANSNIAVFNYTRNVYSLTLTWSY
jgi:tetratricopeptide (TPR) repeat protein